MKTKAIQREEVCHFLVSRVCRALNYALAAAPRVLVLQRKPARRLILEMSSALAVWEVTRRIHAEHVTSMTQCFRKQSIQTDKKLRNVVGVRSSP